jgi:hypothetical protein
MYISGYAILSFSFFSYRALQIRYKQYSALVADGIQMAINNTFGKKISVADAELIAVPDIWYGAKTDNFSSLHDIWKYPRCVATAMREISQRTTKTSWVFTATILPPIVGICGFLAVWAERLTISISGQ